MLLLVGVLLAGVLVVVLVTRRDQGPSLEGWRLDLDSGFATVPESTWKIENGTVAANESSYHLAANVSTRSGILRVQAKPESAGGLDYTSGRLNTNGTYSLPDYFRAEVRAKVPFQQGMWAAPLWFRPVDGGPGEIDLVETYGQEVEHPLVHQTIHPKYFAAQEKSVVTPFAEVSDRPATGWHTYTVEKTPGSITMWVDGHRTAYFTSSSVPWFDRYFEAGQRWNLRVNLQVGGNYGLPDAGTNWSGDHTVMQVDYIRTWIRA